MPEAVAGFGCGLCGVVVETAANVVVGSPPCSHAAKPPAPPAGAQKANAFWGPQEFEREVGGGYIGKGAAPDNRRQYTADESCVNRGHDGCLHTQVNKSRSLRLFPLVQY